MKINTKILSIPPYLTTTWDQVASIYQTHGKLCVILKQGQTIEIPDLSTDTIDMVFKIHREQVENQANDTSATQFPFNTNPESLSNAIQFGISGMDSFGSFLQHDLGQKNAPDLPEEVLSKIESIAKIVSPSDDSIIPRAEPHCNCPFCQIARAISKGMGEDEAFIREDDHAKDPIEEEDLRFQQWHIEVSNQGENMYTVKNKLNPEETYQVYLGKPVGCTCGNKGCEHIIAVLNS
ncbi:MAG: hypothetical protein WD595_07030 [Waddliaceae bacterium]